VFIKNSTCAYNTRIVRNNAKSTHKCTFEPEFNKNYFFSPRVFISLLYAFESLPSRYPQDILSVFCGSLPFVTNHDVSDCLYGFSSNEKKVHQYVYLEPPLELQEILYRPRVVALFLTHFLFNAFSFFRFVSMIYSMYIHKICPIAVAIFYCNHLDATEI